MQANILIFEKLHSLIGYSAPLDTLFGFLASGFDYVVIVMTIVVIFFLYDPRSKQKVHSFEEIWLRLRRIVFVSVSGGMAWLVAKGIKAIVHAPRPFLLLDNVTPLFHYGAYDSFPSGHATFFAAVATALYLYKQDLGIVFGVFAILISVARVVAGIHFPLDILAGYVLGGSISYAIYKIYKYGKKKAIMIPWLKSLH
jgi:undecaprenyl-diphosphatase